MLEQVLKISRQRGPLILEADRELFDKAPTPHAAGQPDEETGILEVIRREGTCHGPHASSRHRLPTHAGR